MCANFEHLNTFESSTSPRYWGPIFWSYLHTASLYYAKNGAKPTKAEKKRMRTWMCKTFPNLLPCPGCRTHWLEFWCNNGRISIALKDRATFVVSLFIFHNIVTERTHKESLAEARQTIRQLKNGKKTKAKTEIIAKLNSLIAKIKSRPRFTFGKFMKLYYGAMLENCDANSPVYNSTNCVRAMRNTRVGYKRDDTPAKKIKKNLKRLDALTPKKVKKERRVYQAYMRETNKELDKSFQKIERDLRKDE